ncbi:MAG TPA: TetR family transcriptional regulator [Sphingobium sp.]|nr:TetR family transcriptional regulator [Sphingobium sp.]
MNENLHGAHSPSQTRDRLLHAAEILVVRDGMVTLSVRRIAAEADVNSALIRYYFGDTDGLLRELAHRNAVLIGTARTRLLDELDKQPAPDLAASIDALVLPLWAPAAMSNRHRAIIVLDEIFARADASLHKAIWAEFAQGVQRVTQALAQALQTSDMTALAWRIRFVTAAALDIPPRAPRSGEALSSPYRPETTEEERLAQFRLFARQALSAL